MLGTVLRFAVAGLILVVLARMGLRLMRGYVHGAWRESETRARGPAPTIDVGGDFRLRCPECGLEVQIHKVPDTSARDDDDEADPAPGAPYQMKALRHCREEMEVVTSEVIEPDLST